MLYKRHYIGLKTIAIDEIKRFLRIWPQTLMSSSLNIMLYFIIFSYFADTRIEQNTSYLQFIAPGLIMMAIITNSYGNVAFSLWSHRACGSIDELVVSPLPNYLILIGYCVGGMLRGLFVGILVTCIALFFTQLKLYNIAVTLTIAVFTAALFSLMGFINAIVASKFDDVLFVPTLILTPLTILGGIFYSIAQLPSFWQHVCMANPILYIIETFRFGMLGLTNTNIYASMTVVILSVLAVFYLNLYLMDKGIGFSK